MSTTTPSSSTSSTTSTSTTYITDPVSISGFNRGPVTATFTPPASCLSTLTSQTNQIYFGHRGSGYLDTACYPSSTSALGPNAWDIYYYSPAQCPSGWAEATSITSWFGRPATQLTLGPDTTAMVCCPSGYFYAGNDHACQSNIASTTTTLRYINPVLNNNVWYSTDAKTPSTTTITMTGTSSYWVLGDGIAVWWQSSDLKAFAGATQTTSSPISATNGQTTTGTSTPSGLTSGAKIGIGIGIPLAVIAFGLAGFFVCLRRRRRSPVPQIEPPVAEGKPELQDTSKNRVPDQVAAQEMYSDNEPYNHSSHHELPS